MKKWFICLILLGALTTSAIAHPEHGDRRGHHDYPPPPPPVYLVNETLDNFESNFPDCDRHFLVTQARTYYYSDGRVDASYLYSVINASGQVIIPYSHSIQHIIFADSHYFIVNNAYLLSENNTELSLANKFQRIKNLDTNRLLVKKDKRWGIITYNKEEIVPITFNSIKEINRNIYIVKLNKEYGIYDINGKCILQTNNKKISKLGNIYYKVEKDNKYGVIDIYGNILAPIKYKKVKLDKNTLKVSRDGYNYNTITHSL